MNDNDLAKKFYLETPSLERKNEIIDYINEFVEYKSDINGTGSLDKILEGYTFEQALERCLNMENREYAEKNGRCRERLFYLLEKMITKLWVQSTLGGICQKNETIWWKYWLWNKTY